MSSSPLLRVSELEVRLGTERIFKNVGFELAPSQKMAIVGPNGSGKSTLVKAILDLVPNVQGEVFFEGKARGPEFFRAVSYVPQRGQVDWDFPILVEDVVLMGFFQSLKFWQRPSAEQRARAHKIMERLGLMTVRHKKISQISGGQQQKTFLARALLSQPRLILLDEPTEGLDLNSQSEILKILDEEAAHGVAVLCVLHNLNQVVQHFSHTLLMNRALLQQGPSSQVLGSPAAAEAFGFPVNWSKERS